MSDSHILRGLAPVLPNPLRVLVLGSMPGVKSLTDQQYYAHPRNAFWPIMEDLSGVLASADYAQRCAGLQALGIGLWDVVGRCRRRGSLDSNIDNKSIIINSIDELIKVNNSLKLICLNGAKADELFRNKVLPSLEQDLVPELVKMPSTSPANASWSQDRKRQVWLETITPHLPAHLLV